MWSFVPQGILGHYPVNLPSLDTLAKPRGMRTSTGFGRCLDASDNQQATTADRSFGRFKLS